MQRSWGGVLQSQENKENKSSVTETQWVRKREAQEKAAETAVRARSRGDCRKPVQSYI